MRPRFAAILYVNRSGSTLLSRRLSEHNDIFVLPEVEFIEKLLIDRKNGVRRSGDNLFGLIRADPRYDALGLDDGVVRNICNKNADGDLPNLLVDIAITSIGRFPMLIVFKRETLIYLIKDLEEVFGNIFFIHIVRDPRSVVNSMLRTPVPEKPGFNMARSDVMFAAYHWQRYVRYVRAVKTALPVVWVRYEDLENTELTSNLLDNLGLHDAPMTGNASRSYRISSVDRDIHPLIFHSFSSNRIVGWQHEMKIQEIYVIEKLCRKEINLLGYSQSVSLRGFLDFAMIYAKVQHWKWALYHTFKTLIVYLKRPGGLKSLFGRVQLSRYRRRR